MKNKYFKFKINFRNKIILITGGTGTFGQAFVLKLLKYFEPKKLIILSRDEFKQYEMEKKFRSLGSEKLRFFLGDVRDVQRLKVAFKDVDFVIHTAALKHVALAEYNRIQQELQHGFREELLNVQIVARESEERIKQMTLEPIPNENNVTHNVVVN